jgi:RHS repeat-associated protein
MGMTKRSFHVVAHRHGFDAFVRSLRLYLKISLGLILMSSGAMAAGPPPMTTPGQFGVSATGAATYSIPIVVPPGTAGLAPSLSLNYSSQSGNGILGFGWSLGGLPAMTRCPQTYAQDGTHMGVNYNANDRFCLDGQRLLLVAGQHYGDDLSEYRTEIESFSRIIAHNATNISGPGWFEVHTKSGQIIELGNSPDSRILASGTSVARLWAASKISDTVGNYMQVFYTPPDQGQYYPDHIIYTGNTTAHTNPYNSVYFLYQSRNDPSTLYHAGSMISTAKLLSDIKTFTNIAGTGTPVTDYKLGYTLGNAPFSQLTSVQRCDGSGTSAGCLAPTTFGWQTASTWSSRIIADSMPTITAPASGISSAGTDIDGDGNPDGYTTPLPGIGGCEPLYLNNGSTWTLANMTESYNGISGQPACFVTGYPFGGDSAMFDIDGDGLADMNINVAYPITCFCFLRNDGQGHFNQFGGTNATVPIIQTGGINTDVNGDGLGDFSGYNYSTGLLSTAINQTTPSGPAFNIVTTPVYSNNDPLESVGDAGDVDGDGCADFRAQGAETSEIILSCRSTPTTIPIPYYTTNGILRIYNGDFNGDGNADYLVVPGSGRTATLNISTGTSYVITNVPGLNQNGGNTAQYFLGDVDGDGKTDVVRVDLGHMYVYTWASGTLALALTVDINLPQPGCDWKCGNGYDGTMWTQDFDGDGCTDLVVHSDTYFYIKFGCHPPLLMTSISNGVGAATAISYGKLNDNQPLYTKCTGQPGVYGCGDIYPTQAVDGPIYVVSQIDTSNGLGACVPNAPPPNNNCFTTSYAYAGAKNDLKGRGFLGYQQVTATDHQTGVVETTTYNTLFPLTGTVLEKKRTLNSVVLSDTINSYLSVPAMPVMGTPTFVYLSVSTVTGHEVDGTALPSATTANTNPDGYGNIQTVNVTVTDGSSKTTQNTYSNDTTNWFLGRLTQTVVTSIVGTSTIMRTSSFHYNPSNGVLDKEIIEPTATGCNGNNTACLLETDYTLDPFGHHQVAIVSGAGFASRTTTVYYDANGTFVTSTQNNLGQTDATDYSGPNGAAFGGPTSHNDLNNLQTAWTIDTLGRETLETRPGAQGTKTAVSYQYCNLVYTGTASCPLYGAYLVQTTPYAYDGATQDGPVTKTYYDSLGRVIDVDVEGFDGPGSGCTLAAPCWIRTTTAYDGNGNLAQTSRPYYVNGGTPQWTVYNYGTPPDPYGRPITVTAPNNGVTTFTYTGLGNAGSQTSVKNALNKTTITQKSAQGLTSAVINALSKTTSYVYDAYGDLLTVTDPLGNQIANTYDIRGNKQTMYDPDMGLWNYSYDALGEVITQVDPNERANTTITTMSYDGLGRLKVRTQPDQTDNWTYDTAANGVGMLASATGSNASYSRTPVYDSLSRPTQVTLTIGNKSYSYNRSYNSDSRLATLSYPSGFVAKYVYTTLGYLYQIQDNATSAVLWTAKSRDAELHLTEAQTGNGVDTIQVFYPQTGLVEQIRATNDGQDDGSVANLSTVFDAIGNLSSRADTYASTEQFCYDALNRLTNYTINGATCRSGFGVLKSVAYDDIGNITNKSDLADTNGGTGTYSYNLPQHPLPHAVMSISGTVNGSQSPGYRYDADGNLTCEYTGPNCSHGAITKETDAYWSFNMTHTISDGGTSATLTYDSEHQRLTQALTFASTTTTTNYLNDPTSGAFAEKVISGSTITWNDYLTVDGRLVGERICSAIVSNCPAANAAWQYFITDHLGSVSVVTNGATGAVTARESFDAWGKQRNPDWSDDSTCSQGLSAPDTRGFIGQEEIAALCLVNLNARLYDPSIGRFLSADSVVPDPQDGQSYNRYSYTNNRPLSLTDPTGHEAGDPNNGQCGLVCFGDGDGQGSNDDMRCAGNCSGGYSGIGSTDTGGSYSFDFGTGTTGSAPVQIALNSNGSSAMTPDPAKNDVGVSGQTNANDPQATSNCDPKSVALTGAAQNASGDSSGAPTQIETVVVTAERKVDPTSLDPAYSKLPYGPGIPEWGDIIYDKNGTPMITAPIKGTKCSASGCHIDWILGRDKKGNLFTAPNTYGIDGGPYPIIRIDHTHPEGMDPASDAMFSSDDVAIAEDDHALITLRYDNKIYGFNPATMPAGSPQEKFQLYGPTNGAELCEVGKCP